MTKTKIITDNYGSADAPDASKFGVGAKTLGDVQKTTDTRRELSQDQSTTRGPVRRDA